MFPTCNRFAQKQQAGSWRYNLQKRQQAECETAGGTPALPTLNQVATAAAFVAPAFMAGYGIEYARPAGDEPPRYEIATFLSLLSRKNGNAGKGLRQRDTRRGLVVARVETPCYAYSRIRGKDSFEFFASFPGSVGYDGHA